MSGGSQHNPNGRQPQLGAGWSPLQLQVANFLARAPQAHMSERGVTWHTPTPPPHLYHVPAPSPPDPLQAMKASSNSVFRHTATPPDLYRHTPTPPDKHLMRHTPSPGDVKSGAPIPPPELYQHLAPGRDKLVRPDDLLAYGRGVDLSVGGARGANGSAPAPQPAPHPAPPAAPALSVRDAPTINSLIARAQPRAGHARVDSLLERLSSPGAGGAGGAGLPAPASPHSVIVHPRAPPARTPTPTPTPSPPSSNEDSADSCGAPPGSKRKRKPERTIRVPSVPVPAPPALPQSPHAHTRTDSPARNTPTHNTPVENGETHNDQVKNEEKDKICEPEEDPKVDMELDTPLPEPKILENKNPSPEPHARRKERSNSAETIDDIAAMIASDKPQAMVAPLDLGPGAEADEPTPTTIDKLKSVLSSPHANDGKDDKEPQPEEPKKSPPKTEEKEKEKPPEAIVESAAAPKRRSPRTSNSESTNVPVESPSEGKPAEPEAEAPGAEPTAASFVEVENQLEKMFAGIEEETPMESKEVEETNKPKKRRKSAPTKGETKPGRRSIRGASTGDRRKAGKKKGVGKMKKQKEAVKDAYDSGSNASSSRSRGPYIQIRGPRDSPLSVSVINAATGEDEAEASTARRKGPDEFRNGLRKRGLHASTLGLRYDATTPDATWLCAFCEKGPHAAGLGDLFGPYTVDTDCEEYRVLDEATRRRYSMAPSPNEVWFHEACAVWAPGLVACGARLWGLAGAVWAARGAKCAHCQRAGAGVACHSRGCRARTHVPCAASSNWVLREAEFTATCPRHA